MYLLSRKEANHTIGMCIISSLSWFYFALCSHTLGTQIKQQVVSGRLPFLFSHCKYKLFDKSVAKKLQKKKYSKTLCMLWTLGSNLFLPLPNMKLRCCLSTKNLNVATSSDSPLARPLPLPLWPLSPTVAGVCQAPH